MFVGLGHPLMSRRPLVSTRSLTSFSEVERLIQELYLKGAKKPYEMLVLSRVLEKNGGKRGGL